MNHNLATVTIWLEKEKNVSIVRLVRLPYILFYSHPQTRVNKYPSIYNVIQPVTNLDEIKYDILNA